MLLHSMFTASKCVIFCELRPNIFSLNFFSLNLLICCVIFDIVGYFTCHGTKQSSRFHCSNHPWRSQWLQRWHAPLISRDFHHFIIYHIPPFYYLSYSSMNLDTWMLVILKIQGRTEVTSGSLERYCGWESPRKCNLRYWGRGGAH